MFGRHKDELICDMAETYHIYDLRGLPLKTLAVLACGLSADGRVMRKMRGSVLTFRDSLMCLAIDKISQLVWLQSKDGEKNRNRPKSILEELTKPKAEPKGFSSVSEFEAARKRIIGG